MNRTMLLTLGAAGSFAAGLALYTYSGKAKAAAPQNNSGNGGGGNGGGGNGGDVPQGETGGGQSQQGSITWENVLPLPTAKDVLGDLSKNWGKTPNDLRALFQLAEEASGIKGAGRVLATISKRESGFVTTAQNGDEVDEATERAASRKGYENNKAKNPPLQYGEAAADFGSGGLFGALAPYFLWTGVPEIGAKAPLLSADPRIMFLPRVATFGAIVYMQRILANYKTVDIGDIKVGWASPSLLIDPPKGGRGGETYNEVRERFFGDAASLGIDLNDQATIPWPMSTKNWPGVLKVFERIVGVLPTRKQG